MEKKISSKSVEIKHLRKIFFEIVDLLSKNNLNFWVGGGLAEQIAGGVIDDDESHDIDFHILAKDRGKLKKILKDNAYKIREQPWHKIQLYSKTGKKEQAEFVFLNEENNGYTYQARGQQYKCSKKVFGNRIYKIKSVEVKIPWPIKEYRNKKK